MKELSIDFFYVIDQNANLKEIIQKLRQEPDKDKQSLDGKERAVRNFKNQRVIYFSK